MKKYKFSFLVTAILSLMWMGALQAQYDDLYYDPDTDGDYYNYNDNTSNSSSYTYNDNNYDNEDYGYDDDDYEYYDEDGRAHV